jgi:Expansin C-terminal domain
MDPAECAGQGLVLFTLRAPRAIYAYLCICINVKPSMVLLDVLQAHRTESTKSDRGIMYRYIVSCLTQETGGRGAVQAIQIRGSGSGSDNWTPMQNVWGAEWVSILGHAHMLQANVGMHTGSLLSRI